MVSFIDFELYVNRKDCDEFKIDIHKEVNYKNGISYAYTGIRDDLLIQINSSYLGMIYNDHPNKDNILKAMDQKLPEVKKLIDEIYNYDFKELIQDDSNEEVLIVYFVQNGSEYKLTAKLN